MGVILGIDVGGTGIKGALVDTEQGIVLQDKIKYGTPLPSNPENVLGVINQLIDDMDWRGKNFGCGFPSVIKNNVCLTAANIDDSWIDVDLHALFYEHTGSRVTFTNDADAAAYAEMQFGEGKGKQGTIVLLTLGTGIGSGIFLDGKLLPNSEFGHLKYQDSIFEHYASNGARKKKKLSWKEWAKELNIYLNHVDLLISPDLIIIGGGVSKHFLKYSKYFDVKTPVVPAAMGNNAGIIGAAMMSELIQ